MYKKVRWKFHYDEIIFTQVFARQSHNTFTGLYYKRVDALPQKWYDAFPHITEQVPKVLTRSVNLRPARDREKGNSKTDRHTDRKTDSHTDRRTDRETQTDTDTHRQTQTGRQSDSQTDRRFEGCTSQIRSYLEVDFLHDVNTSIDMEVTISKHCSFHWLCPNPSGLEPEPRVHLSPNVAYNPPWGFPSPPEWFTQNERCSHCHPRNILRTANLTECLVNFLSWNFYDPPSAAKHDKAPKVDLSEYPQSSKPLASGRLRTTWRESLSWRQRSGSGANVPNLICALCLFLSFY